MDGEHYMGVIIVIFFNNYPTNNYRMSSILRKFSIRDRSRSKSSILSKKYMRRRNCIQFVIGYQETVWLQQGGDWNLKSIYMESNLR